MAPHPILATHEFGGFLNLGVHTSIKSAGGGIRAGRTLGFGLNLNSGVTQRR